MITIKNLDLFKDNRGLVGSLYKDIDNKFCEYRISISKQGCIRGFHGDNNTDKLLVCLDGQIKVVTYSLKEKKREELFLNGPEQSVFVPRYHLLGHQVITSKAVLYYAWSDFYHGPESQYSIHWNDPTINPLWTNLPYPNEPILSERDRNAKFLNEII